MPTLSPAHYLTKIDSFIGHWTDLTADRAALATEMASLEGFINDWEGHRMDRDNRKTAVRGPSSHSSEFPLSPRQELL